MSRAEDAPLAPDLQLDWLSSTESEHSDDDSGIEVLSVQYNNNNNSTTNNNNNVSHPSTMYKKYFVLI